MSTVGTAAPPSRSRPPRSARRVGYVMGTLVNGALLWVVNVEPGWQVLPFLTPDFAGVLPLVNLSIAVGLAADLIHLVADPPWLRALRGVVVPAVGILPLIALWRTFPFAFDDRAFAWDVVVRVLLGLGIAGSLVGLVVALSTLLTRPRVDADGASR